MVYPAPLRGYGSLGKRWILTARKEIASLWIVTVMVVVVTVKVIEYRYLLGRQMA